MAVPADQRFTTSFLVRARDWLGAGRKTPQEIPAARSSGQRAAWLLMALVVGCFLVTGAAALLFPPRFETHDQAVGYVLDQHGIAHDQIVLYHAWPDTLSRHTYSADVVIHFQGTDQVNGRLECKVERSQCYLYVRRLGITHELIPELTVTPPWLAQAQRYLSSLVTFVRSLAGG
jgi:hypothetical protein